MTVLRVGVDVSYQTLDVASGVRREQVTRQGRFSNDPAGFGQLAQVVTAAAQAAQAETIHLILEPTGGYEQPLVQFALTQGWRLSLPNPRQLRAWAQGSGRRGKSDPQDSQMLTAYGCAEDPPAWRPVPQPVADLEALLGRRDDLEAMRQQERNRRHALQAREAYQGPLAESLEHSLAYLAQALAELEQHIQDHLDQHPDLKAEAQRLRTVPGIGERNVLPILVLLTRWGVLTQQQGDRQGLTAYVGLDPQPYQSGTSVYRPAAISRRGNPRLRRRLYMGALGGVRGQNVLREFYQHLVQQGKRKRVALVAAARKLLIWAWAVFRSKCDFDPQKAASARSRAAPRAA